MVLLIDNYDSFTYNLYDYILQSGHDCRVIRHDEMTIEEIASLNFSSAVISPGPQTPQQAGITLPFIQQFYHSIPILGICLGHQAIGQFFGAALVKANYPMHGKTSMISHTGHFLFQGLPATLQVMRYHSLVLNVPEQSGLEVIASTADDEVMAIAHARYPVAGLQFHPESVLTPQGLAILRNWFQHIAA